MNMRRLIITAMTTLLGCAALLLAGCGSSDSGGGTGGDGTDSNPAVTRLVGGAVQGKPLALAGTASTLAGDPLIPSRDGIGAAARFNNPCAITTDGARLYVADSGSSTIRTVLIATGEVTTLAGSAGMIGTADGTGAAARFNRPRAITIAGTNLYVADTGNSTIRKVAITTGKVTTLAGVAGVTGMAPDYFNNPEGITTDGTNLYVADTGSSTIRTVMIATGAVSTLAGQYQELGSKDGFSGSARFQHPNAIVCFGTDIYVSSVFSWGSSTIRKIKTTTGEVTTLTDEADEKVRIPQAAGLATDGTNLYTCDFSNNIIYKIDLATVTKTKLVESSASVLNAPSGLACDGTSLYVADTNNNLIRKVDTTTGAVTTLAGSPPGADGIGPLAMLDSPTGIATDGTSLYVSDSTNNLIRRVDITSAAVTTLAGAVRPYGSRGPADGTGADARFDFPAGITTDGVNVYVTETGGNTIRKVVIATGEVTTLAGQTGWLGSSDGTGEAALFNAPAGITTDGTSLYVADTNNSTIRRIIIATGEVTTLAGSAGISGSADGTGEAARFNYPGDITTDGTSLYVADTNNCTIRRIIIATGEVTTLAGSAGTEGAADGRGAVASFSYPIAITTDGTSLYVADTINNTIRKVVIAYGYVTTVSGRAGETGAVDGSGSQSRFNQPSGITTDGKNLYVSDTVNNTIRMIR